MLTREYPPDVYGGAGVHVDFLVRELRRLVDVDVHCFGEPRPDAIAHQGFGFADQVAGEVRDRSRSADAVVERTTRRLLRRRPRIDPPTGPLPNPGTP